MCTESHTRPHGHNHPLQLVFFYYYFFTHPAHTNIHRLATAYQKTCSPPDQSSRPLKGSQSGEPLPWDKLPRSREKVYLVGTFSKRSLQTFFCPHFDKLLCFFFSTFIYIRALQLNSPQVFHLHMYRRHFMTQKPKLSKPALHIYSIDI